MRQFFLRAAALMAVLMLLCTCALAQPRYPDHKGSITDAAAVLSKDTLDDLSELSRKLDDEDTLELHIATVDFLDGVSLSEYGQGLRTHWRLDSDDLLLLMAVGEDKFGFFPGDKVSRELPSTLLDKLLSTHFSAAFLRQEYDSAIAALMPALVTEINKGYDKNISIGGLFGVQESFSMPDWFTREILTIDDPEPDLRQRVTHEDEDTGLSLGKVILTVFLLMVIFGNRGRRRRSCMGCGCAPFSSILAALGLWKLWDDR